MFKNMNYLILIIFLFCGCSTSIDMQKVNKTDFDKLKKVVSIIKHQYIEDISKKKFLDINKNYKTKKDIENEIKIIMNSLDLHSTYINKKDNLVKKIKQNTSSLSFKIVDKKYLYISIPSFYKDISKELSMIIKANSELSLILDLRNNLGGYFKEAIKTVDLFVNSGMIVSQVGRNKNLTRRYYATRANSITSKPLVILINEKTASSAEIVSGALQDAKRATLIGTKSYGKGTIQALIYINDDKTEAIKLTIGKYYLSSKRAINNKIQPNIFVQKNMVSNNLEDIQLIEAIEYLKI